MKRAIAFSALSAALLGCGEGAVPAVSTDAGADVPHDVIHDTPDVSQDVSKDVFHDVPTDVGAPARCAEGTACDGLLDAQGRCAARCVAAEYALRCRGVVRAGVCHGAAPLETQTYERDGWRREAVTLPAEASVGESVTAVFSLRNTDTEARPLAWQVEPFEGWVIESESPASGTSREVAAGEAVQVTLRLRPSAPSALDPSRQVAARVGITGVDGRGGWPLIIPVRYADAEVRCGARSFPRFRAEGEGRYGDSVCCDGVFYPGAQCCASTDCAGGGRCIDGRCARGLTTVPWSATPLAGPQRVLVVLVDSQHPPPANPCEDQSAALREELGLDAIERWYARAAEARVGRSTASWRWTVLSGLRAATIGLPEGAVTQEALHASAEAWLRARGCLRGFDEDYDRTVVYSPHVDLAPYGGRVFRTHRIAQSSLDPRLMAHELGHTFGASDRYLDLGGEFQWAGALMARSGDGLGESARDDVFWGEVGLGDLDADGVIDLHQPVLAPERVTITELTVTSFPATEGLGYTLRLGYASGERAAPGLPQEVTLSVPGTEHRVRLDRWDALGGGERAWQGYLFAPRDIPTEVLERAQRDGRITLRVEARAHFTREDYTRATVSFDETRAVPLTPRGSSLAPPRRATAVQRGGCGHP